MNPTGKAWLPGPHTIAGADRQYTALYSNTSRAHELGMTHDWVIVYRDDHDGHGQWTLITSQFGPMQGKRHHSRARRQIRRLLHPKDGKAPVATTLPVDQLTAKGAANEGWPTSRPSCGRGGSPAGGHEPPGNAAMAKVDSGHQSGDKLELGRHRSGNRPVRNHRPFNAEAVAYPDADSEPRRCRLGSRPATDRAAGGFGVRRRAPRDAVGPPSLQ